MNELVAADDLAHARRLVADADAAEARERNRIKSHNAAVLEIAFGLGVSRKGRLRSLPKEVMPMPGGVLGTVITTMVEQQSVMTTVVAMIAQAAVARLGQTIIIDDPDAPPRKQYPKVKQIAEMVLAAQDRGDSVEQQHALLDRIEERYEMPSTNEEKKREPSH